ncbi:MAG: helix-turn-helix transcriptional regulator [Pseudomonadota bacterium]
MELNELIRIRNKLAKTQKQLAAILGISVRTIRSYEQGTRSIPSYIERQLYFILSQKNETLATGRLCWDVKKCPRERRERCPAWEFKCGALCWFINGTVCECATRESWNDKMAVCHKCEVLRSILDEHDLGNNDS